MNAMPLVLGALAVFALAYRFYFSFITARVLALDDNRLTPSTVFDSNISLAFLSCHFSAN
jgi:carbon starvation protein CstA